MSNTDKLLVAKFNEYLQFNPDKSHVAACAIFDVIFQGNLVKWNAPQDSKWMKKYNRGMYILANAGCITLWAK